MTSLRLVMISWGTNTWGRAQTVSILFKRVKIIPHTYLFILHPSIYFNIHILYIFSLTLFLFFLLSFTGALTKSQFPVFTIYAQKSCLKMRPCERAWCIDRVQGYALKDHIKRSATAVSRQDCYEMCFGETDFLCRWV